MTRQPVLFVAHGSPMNALADNEFTRGLQSWGRSLAKGQPKAILAISAHWQTAGLAVTAMEAPRTIYDFAGFPPALSQVRYSANGSPALAKRIAGISPDVVLDQTWGLDHGTWSILVHLFPKADVPVVQLSLNRPWKPEDHWAFAERLQPLRDEGILILGSGNIVHSFHGFGGDEEAPPHPLALEFDTAICKALEARDSGTLTSYRKLGASARFAAPTPEHFLPLLYCAGLGLGNESVTYPTQGFQFGSFSMRSVQIG